MHLHQKEDSADTAAKRTLGAAGTSRRACGLKGFGRRAAVRTGPRGDRVDHAVSLSPLSDGPRSSLISLKASLAPRACQLSATAATAVASAAEPTAASAVESAAAPAVESTAADEVASVSEPAADEEGV